MSKQDGRRKKKSSGAREKRRREDQKRKWKQDAERREQADLPAQSPNPGRGQIPDKRTSGG